MSIGIGLSINNTRAVFEALFNKQSEFARTPKYRIEGDADEWVGKKLPPVGRRAAAHRAGARPLLHGDGVLRAGQPDLRHGAVPGAVPGRLPLHGPAVDRRSSTPGDSDGVAAEAAARAVRVSEVEGRGPPSHARHDLPQTSIASSTSAGVSSALAAGKTTILKDNISWHFPFPGGEHHAVAARGHDPGAARAAASRDQVCVQNKTVVTNAFKGEDLNHYVPIFKRYDIPVLYNFKDEDMTWVALSSRRRGCACSTASSPKASTSPTTSSARTSSTCRRRSATSTRRPPAR